MIVPSALNVLIIGLSVVIFAFLWRMVAAYFVKKGGTLAKVGQAMAVTL